MTWPVPGLWHGRDGHCRDPDATIIREKENAKMTTSNPKGSGMSTKEMKLLVKNMNLFELSSLADIVQEKIAALRKNERLEAINAVKLLAAKFDIELEATLSNKSPAPAESPSSPAAFSEPEPVFRQQRAARPAKTRQTPQKSIPKELLDLFNNED